MSDVFRVQNLANGLLNYLFALPKFDINFQISQNGQHFQLHNGNCLLKNSINKVVSNVSIQLEVIIKKKQGDSKFKIYTPRYHKSKQASWCILLVNETSDQLLAFKRIGEIDVNHSSNIEFTLSVDEIIPDKNNLQRLKFHLIQDSMFGLDTSLELNFEL